MENSFEIIQKQIKEIKQLTVMSHKEVLNVDDLALLYDVSKSHIYKLCWAKKIPHYKSEGGKLTYFRKKEIENWLCANRVSTIEEIESNALLYCETNKKGGAR